MSKFRSLVLKSFKQLHRTRMRVFDGDQRTLDAARLRINEEFKKNKHVSDEESIKTMIQFSNDVERELRTGVIQARAVKPGTYEARITKDTAKLDNSPFDDSAAPPAGPAPCRAPAAPAAPAAPER